MQKSKFFYTDSTNLIHFSIVLRISTLNSSLVREIENHMLDLDIACMGLGTPQEDRRNKRGHNTYKQRESFKNTAEKGDILYLYRKGEGIIAYTIYNGTTEEITTNKAPWNESDEIQINIDITGWIKYDNPTLCYHSRSSL